MSMAIVLLSGGQDSATCLAIAKEQSHKIHCICFDYGQRHRIEVESSKALAEIAGATFQLVDVGFLSLLSNSALVIKNEAIVHLDDLLLRRTRIGLLVEQGCLIYENRIKAICCKELNWTEPQWLVELERYKSIWNKYYSIPA